jgi:dihydropteroate synthase
MSGKSMILEKNRTLNCRGKLVLLDRPLVMGILNLTPDSFFDGGKYNCADAALARAEQMLEEGADIIDIGAYSSRPGAEHINEEEELKRLLPTLEEFVKRFPKTLISIDTFRSRIAEKALDIGAHIINDISGGNLDSQIPAVATKFNAPYICMHMKGNPQNMQKGLKEESIMPDVLSFFAHRVPELVKTGVKDVIIDPGFGFGKTLEQNYEMVNQLSDFAILGKPIVVGVSRKSMIRLKYGESSGQTLKGTIEVHKELLQNGANILRVHDVKEAVELIK